MGEAPPMNMGERPGLPGYPAPMSALAQPTTGPLRWHQNRLTAAVLSFVAAVVAVAGSFVPLFSGILSFSGESVEMSFTAWGVSLTGSEAFLADPGITGTPRYGYPLVFAGIALLCAAAVAAFAAMPAATPGTHRLAGVATAVGAAFLLGTVWTIALQAVSWVDSFGPLGDSELAVDSSASYEAGHWLLLSAALLAVLAAVLGLLPTRRTSAAQYAYASPNQRTPPYGIPMGAPVVYALPTTVDPLTGHPAGQAAPVDPLTGLPMTPPGAAAYPAPFPNLPIGADPYAVPPPLVDPNTGVPVAPAGSQAFPAQPFPSLPVGADPYAVPPPLVDPNTGVPVAPAGSQAFPAQPDPFPGLPVEADPYAVPPRVVNPNTGLPAGQPNPAPLVPLVPPVQHAVPESPPGPPREDPLAEPGPAS